MAERLSEPSHISCFLVLLGCSFVPLGRKFQLSLIQTPSSSWPTNHMTLFVLRSLRFPQCKGAFSGLFNEILVTKKNALTLQSFRSHQIHSCSSQTLDLMQEPVIWMDSFLHVHSKTIPGIHHAYKNFSLSKNGRTKNTITIHYKSDHEFTCLSAGLKKICIHSYMDFITCWICFLLGDHTALVFCVWSALAMLIVISGGFTQSAAICGEQDAVKSNTEHQG